MRIVKVNATASTNTYLKELYRDKVLNTEVLLWTDHQYGGRGQRGATWESEPFKNLTFSIYKRAANLKIDRQFYITMACSLAIYEFLKELNVQRIAIKWPNDILAGSRKLCGILIESLVRKGELDAVVIGVGLNVNQTHFQHAPKATSLKLETNKDYTLDLLLEKLNTLVEKYVGEIASGDLNRIKADYEANLFKKDTPALFSTGVEEKFQGIIRGTTEQGQLIVEDEHEKLHFYSSKEIKMHY